MFFWAVCIRLRSLRLCGWRGLQQMCDISLRGNLTQPLFLSIFANKSAHSDRKHSHWNNQDSFHWTPKVLKIFYSCHIQNKALFPCSSISLFYCTCSLIFPDLTISASECNWAGSLENQPVDSHDSPHHTLYYLGHHIITKTRVCVCVCVCENKWEPGWRDKHTVPSLIPRSALRRLKGICFGLYTNKYAMSNIIYLSADRPGSHSARLRTSPRGGFRGDEEKRQECLHVHIHPSWWETHACHSFRRTHRMISVNNNSAALYGRMEVVWFD